MHMNKYNLTIKCDYFCRLDLDGYPYTIVRKNEDCTIEVSEGPHAIKCAWTTNPDIFILREIDVTEHIVLEISFEDYIFEHPEVIKTADDFDYCLYNFPRFKAAWEVFDGYSVDVGDLGDAIWVKKGELQGYVDHLGREALDHYYIKRDGNNYGFACGLGREVVPPIYTRPLFDRYDYNELTLQELEKAYDEPGIGVEYGIGIVHKNDKWGYINLRGTIPEVQLYDKIYPRSFAEDIDVMSNGLFGIYNIVKGREVVPCLYDRVRRHGDYYVYEQGCKYGILDIDGAKINDILYDEIKLVTEDLLLASKDGICWEINSDGEKIFPLEPDQVIASFYGHIIIEKDDKYGVIDRNGQQIIPCEYNNFGTEHVSRLFWIEDFIEEDTGHVVQQMRVTNTVRYEYYIVEKDGKVGVMNLNGEELLPCVYDSTEYDIDKLISILPGDVQDSSRVAAVPLSPDFYLKKDNEGWKIFDYEDRLVDENVYEDCVVEYGKVSVARNGFYREISRKDAKLVGYYYPYPPTLREDALIEYEIDRERDDETYWIEGYDTIIDSYGNVVWRRE